ncbi:MAG: hypothetical protein ACHQ9S_12100 [Candidatus Binatia bacterium]
MLLGIDTPTSEGLVIEELPADEGWTIVREVGKLGYVVFEYRCRDEDIGDDVGQTIDEDVSFLLQRIADLERRCERLQQEKPTSIELPLHKWNLKKARQRFRRWYREHEPLYLEVKLELRPMVGAILKSEADSHVDPGNLFDRAMENGDVFLIEDYERRKLDRPPLILSRLPSNLASLLAESNEAYRFGLFRATAALCRATLERSIRMILEVGLDTDVAVPIDRHDLASLITSLPDRLLKNRGRVLAHEIRTKANDALHNGVELSEDEAWSLLARTTLIVQALLDRSRLLESQGT